MLYFRKTEGTKDIKFDLLPKMTETEAKTKTETRTETRTKTEKYPTYVTFSKKRHFEDMKYDTERECCNKVRN